MDSEFGADYGYSEPHDFSNHYSYINNNNKKPEEEDQRDRESYPTQAHGYPDPSSYPYPPPHHHGGPPPNYEQQKHSPGIYPPYPYIASHAADPELPEGQIVRVFCKTNPAFNLAVANGGVVMVPADSEDEAQQWIKDTSYGVRVKDNYGHPAFTLVNKKTRQILKHGKLKGQQVLLMSYRPEIRDDDILWTESQDFGEGFKTVRSASDTLLNLTVFEGKKKIRNGSALVLDTWHKGDHQLWKLFAL